VAFPAFPASAAPSPGRNNEPVVTPCPSDPLSGPLRGQVPTALLPPRRCRQPSAQQSAALPTVPLNDAIPTAYTPIPECVATYASLRRVLHDALGRSDCGSTASNRKTIDKLEGGEQDAEQFCLTVYLILKTEATCISETTRFSPSRDSSVGMLTGREVGVRVPVEIKCSLLHSVRTGSGAHPASYPMDTFTRR
jgi:hypothetical protein